MKRYIIMPASILLVIFTTSCARKPQEFRSEAGRFSIMIPATPEESTQTMNTQAGKIDLHMFTAEKGDVGYIVGYSDYPEDVVKQSDPENMLDGSRNGAVSNVNGKLVLESKVSLDGNPGREIVIDAKTGAGQDATVKARIYLVGSRLYQVMVIGPKGQISSADMDEFLQSFKLSQKS